MSWRIDRRLQRTAAWRVAAIPTLAFALGTGAAFLTAYLLVAAGIRGRSDDWLLGETELLAQVVLETPPGDMKKRLVSEVAELARHEVDQGSSESAEHPIFFLVTSEPGSSEIWVGPRGRESFEAAMERSTFGPGVLRSIQVPGWKGPFRVAAHGAGPGVTVYLGFEDLGALKILGGMRSLFAELWAGMIAFGFAISWMGARRILHRVDEITETAAQIGSEGLGRRVPEEGRRDEIARLAQTFNAMLERIEGTVEQIRSLGDALAHDLRSPLTSIRGNLELALTSGDRSALEEAAATALEQLDRLIDDLHATLDVAEAEAGALRVQRRETDVHALLFVMAEVYRPAAEEHGLTLEYEGSGPAVADVDPEMLRRAIANLLDNEIQHVPPGHRVVMSAETRAGSFQVSVADDGPGFPPEIRRRAFERFVKGPGSRGFGIGLALVRAVCRAHGGEAEILDAPGGGARVRLTLPASTPRMVSSS
jgi:signal transduction histidine kinase